MLAQTTISRNATAQALGLPTAGDLRKAVTLAWAFGFEDAAQGNDRQGSTLFELAGRKWREYNAGYDEAIALRTR